MDGYDMRRMIAEHIGALTAVELAEILGMHRNTIFRLAQDTVIPSYQLGGSIRFNPVQVLEWYDTSLVVKG